MFGIVWLLRVFLPLNISMYNYSYLPPTKRINTSHSTVMASFYRYFVGVTDLLAGSVQESSHREHVALHQVPFLQPGLIFVLFADIPPPLLLLLLFYIIYYFLFFSNFIYSFIYIYYLFLFLFLDIFCCLFHLNHTLTSFPIAAIPPSIAPFLLRIEPDFRDAWNEEESPSRWLSTWSKWLGSPHL